MNRPRSGLRKREIALAVGLGALATGAAGLILIDGEAPDHVSGSGRAAALAPFHSVASIGPQDIEITLGKQQAVRSIGGATALDRLELEVEDGVLTIRPRTGRGGFGWWSLPGAPKIEITVASLDAVWVTGSGTIEVGPVEGDRFSGAVNGSGNLSLARLTAAEADLRISGSGDIDAAGEVEHARLSVTGTGDIDGSTLRSRNASISLTGSGDVEAAAEEQATVTIMGNGDVEVHGSAQCTVSRLGRGDVRCGGERQ